MEISLAPMEGITGYIVRNAFARNFGQIDRYFTPFIPAAKRMNGKILRDLAPENNQGIRLVPQLISCRAAEVLEMMKQLRDLGFTECNLNLGCPSGTVVSKKRGSGLLLYPEELRRMLDEIFEKADMPLSVKTRIGFQSLEEWPLLLEIFHAFPIRELIIHPRLRSEQYKGFAHREEFRKAYLLYEKEGRVSELVYNGDIREPSDYGALTGMFPSLGKVMIGRGLLSCPDLACILKGVSLSDTRKSLKDFVDEIYGGYAAIFSGEKDVIMHMKEIWANLGSRFKDSEKLVKNLMRADRPSEYHILVRKIFDTLELKDFSVSG